MDHNSMESHLRQWIFFPYFRYYYNTLGKFESEKRSQVSTGSSVDSQLVDDTFGDDMEMDDDCEEGDNDDIVFVEEVIHEQYLNDCVQEVKPQHTAIALPPSPLLANNRTPSMSHFARFSEESMAREISWEDQAPKGAKVRRSNIVLYFLHNFNSVNSIKKIVKKTINFVSDVTQKNIQIIQIKTFRKMLRATKPQKSLRRASLHKFIVFLKKMRKNQS